MKNSFRNFLKGFGSIVDIFPSSQNDKVFKKFYNGKLSPEKALYKDWENIGNDLRQGMKTLTNGKPHK